MIDQWLNSLSALIANNSWISPMLALAAGVLTSITPCALSSVPLVIGYVGDTSGNEPKRAFRLSIVFSLGMAFTFTILGTTASLLGKLLGSSHEKNKTPEVFPHPSASLWQYGKIKIFLNIQALYLLS